MLLEQQVEGFRDQLLLRDPLVLDKRFSCARVPNPPMRAAPRPSEASPVAAPHQPENAKRDEEGQGTLQYSEGRPKS
jgi:hypothetical protein